MSELLEHELCLLHGKTVMLVRPFFGTQSDSWVGEIFADSEHYPVTFQVKSASQSKSTIFTVADVSKIEIPKDDSVKIIIRLKGPLDYAGHEVVHA